MNIAICDDEKEICDSLNTIIEQYLDWTQNNYKVDIYSSADSLFSSMLNNKSYDVIFLDIEMNGKSGIELGHLIREIIEDERVRIIYISWTTGYALDLFSVRPFDFLIKPLNEDKIRTILKNIIRLQNKEKKYFRFTYKGECVKVVLSDIIFFMSTNRIITLYTVDGKYEFYSRLDNIFKELDNRVFWRIHKSFIVNYDKVNKFEYSKVYMIDNQVLPISQKFRSSIRQKQMDML
ncbi:response regulator transcription factor [Acidaminobacter sp. JC074]|uniref:LytR/AlgR family response regulator transcription factor n=1 Tax=Acidaminobacter sp. JC074 TaxID=2530199 RepID=UPI001F0E96A6|nr:response regulator transcription factor [Acidaminobacter sp. JC074]